MNEIAIPVATLYPVPDFPLTSAELEARWEKLDRLPPDEANTFADDLEAARRQLPPLNSAWERSECIPRCFHCRLGTPARVGQASSLSDSRVYST